MIANSLRPVMLLSVFVVGTAHGHSREQLERLSPTLQREVLQAASERRQLRMGRIQAPTMTASVSDITPHDEMDSLYVILERDAAEMQRIEGSVRENHWTAWSETDSVNNESEQDSVTNLMIFIDFLEMPPSERERLLEEIQEKGGAIEDYSPTLSRAYVTAGSGSVRGHILYDILEHVDAAGEAVPPIPQQESLHIDEIGCTFRLAQTPDEELDMPVTEGSAGRLPALEMQTDEPPLAVTSEPSNIDAARAHGVNYLHENFSLSGAGIRVGSWDAGRVVEDHIEFENRVRQRDAHSRYNAHATHVAGTLVSAGKFREASRGMAPKSELDAYYFRFFDISLDTSVSGASPPRVSNHSYAHPAGFFRQTDTQLFWYGDSAFRESNIFGRYDNYSRNLDKIGYKYPWHTIVVAAGNSRGGRTKIRPKDGDKVFHASTGKVLLDRLPNDFHHGGLDTLSPYGAAKNVITVGAFSGDSFNTFRTDGVLATADFSSWGPTDDGRVKPDLVADGRSLLSTTYSECNDGSVATRAYDTRDGTSMATPVVAGTAVLLNEMAMRMEGGPSRPLYSDEVKAILVHTAWRPEGKGPMPSFGWGALDAPEASRMLQGNNDRALITERESTRQERTFVGDSSGVDPIRVTLVWIDPAGKPAAGFLNLLDDETPMLVHDLDVLLVAPDRSFHFPWSLQRLNDGRYGAVRIGANRRDNVEIIDVEGDDLTAGQWRITITQPSSAVNLSIAISGLTSVREVILPDGDP